jgi:hypothetical protein
MMSEKPWSLPEILVVLVALFTGLAAASFCTFVAILYVPEISLATYRPTATEHAIGVAAAVVGSVLMAAGPLTAWFVRRTKVWLGAAAAFVIAGAVLSVVAVQQVT